MVTDLKHRMERFEQVCKENQIKVTHQRLEIFREIASSEDHPDAEMLCNRVRERIPTLSLDTVYRALWLFNDLGLIHTMGTTHERARFDANMDQHHHFICEVCGLMRDFNAMDLDVLQLPETIYQLGQPSSTHVEVRGICYECAKSTNQSPND